MYCTSCGTLLDEDALFCTNCGSKIESEIQDNVEIQEKSKKTQKINIKKNKKSEIPDETRSCNEKEEKILEDFFEKVGFSEYIEIFKNQKLLKIELLKELTESDFEKIGISALGDIKLLKNIFSGKQFNNLKQLIVEDTTKRLENKDDISDENDSSKILVNSDFDKVINRFQCDFDYPGNSLETGYLYLYCNRIKFYGYKNNFTIPLSKISDITIDYANQDLLSISYNNKNYNFKNF